MELKIKKVLVFVFAAFLASFPLLVSEALAQPDCIIEIRKRAVGVTGGRLAFEFEATLDGNSETFILQPDDNLLFGLAAGNVLTVVELPQEGWTLNNVFCTGDGVGITEVENGVALTCVQGEAVCTFTNVSLDTVPTLSEWGMIATAAGFVLIGAFYAMRRRRATA